ncbi:biofilm PGA synthesis protein PgaB [Ancylomarina longa]|uniref:Biofilm PGA synthesis protein PgaB n=1 Tax=Ancylomarina longa TaxID=2487017 RepID=A0A434AZ24_9BACT|nr:biofilm PGA synthesis protein PgaB [Ancylomarina longa]RUT79786.1 biofilm PGA synthesis protein PgaB [Ancylomarina longa]
MKLSKKSILLVIYLVFLFSPACKRVELKENSRQIKVGVFNINGDSPWCITDAMEALKIDPNIDCEIIRASQIMSDEILQFDAIVFPGGSGRAETESLGSLGIERVKYLVKEKGIAVVGICAGAYIMTNTPDYPCLKLNGFEAIDIEHDHRGYGLTKFALTKKGIDIFPELKNRTVSFCQYYEGPILIPVKDDAPKIELASMLSDIHTVEGSPANMTVNRPFIVTSSFGKGKVASFVGHPESTPGMRWMLPRMIRWATNQKLISYSSEIIRPDFYKHEIIFDQKVEKIQSTYYKNLSGNTKEKLEAIDKVIELACWSAKKWIPGMLRDQDSNVRSKASEALLLLERTDAIPDLQIAIQNETNDKTKQQLIVNLNHLKALLGANTKSQ